MANLRWYGDPKLRQCLPQGVKLAGRQLQLLTGSCKVKGTGTIDAALVGACRWLRQAAVGAQGWGGSLSASRIGT